MNAVVERREPDAPTSLLAVIERAARDPSIDIDKMERLMQMQERIVNRQAEAEFNAAMTAAQAAMGPVSADAINPQTKSKYASYAKLDSVLRPIYTAHGFALSFNEGISTKPEYVMVLCQVSHRAGFSRQYQKEMPADGKGAKGGDVMTKTHASGAAMSYGMRYLLKGIFNVAVGEHDNDGNGGNGAGVTLVSAEQIANIEALLTEIGPNYKAKYLAYMKLGSLGEIPAANYSAVIRVLEARRKESQRS